MATLNPFDLLGDDDAEDPSLLIALQQQKAEAKKLHAASGKPAAAGKQPPPAQGKPAAAQARLPSKPLPPSQAVREAKSESARGGRGGGRGGRGRGVGSGPYHDSANNENSFGSREISVAQGGAPDEVDGRKPFERHGGGYGGPRGSFRGGRRGGFSNGEDGEGDQDRPRRTFDRRSGTGRGNDIKRDGAGQGNWGTQADDLVEGTEEAPTEGEKPNVEKPSGEEDAAIDGNKEAASNEAEEKEPEDKEMTLEEYEKLQEEKRKPLLALKTEERKVDASEFAAMQPLSNKKASDDVFIKLGSEKDKKKELAEKEERAKKSVSINEFLKPAEGERYYSGGRGRGRGRGPRGGYSGSTESNSARAPAIEDPGQFPSLGGK